MLCEGFSGRAAQRDRACTPTLEGWETTDREPSCLVVTKMDSTLLTCIHPCSGQHKGAGGAAGCGGEGAGGCARRGPESDLGGQGGRAERAEPEARRRERGAAPRAVSLHACLFRCLVFSGGASRVAYSAIPRLRCTDSVSCSALCGQMCSRAFKLRIWSRRGRAAVTLFQLTALPLTGSTQARIMQRKADVCLARRSASTRRSRRRLRRWRRRRTLRWPAWTPRCALAQCEASRNFRARFV